ncbi:MAG: NADH-quinone oxidoreductase subunit J [Leptospiraceae bacterium]|nr:NADH-quinone oxidoreductase subunit J [Leptospiraceae bacterium]
MMVETILFFSLATILVVSSLLIITRENPISSALFMVLAFIALAGLYGLLSAGFAAVVQILVYAGGIMVLIIFVIMILNLGKSELQALRPNLMLFLALILITGAFVAWPLALAFMGDATQSSVSTAGNFGSVQAISSQLFGPFVFPFEILSLVLLAAIIGSLILARRRL